MSVPLPEPSESSEISATALAAAQRARVVDLIRGQLEPDWRAERTRLDILDAWWGWKPPLPKPKPGADPETIKLLELSRTPWLRKVVNTTADLLSLEAYGAAAGQPTNDQEEAAGAAGWRAFTRNGLDGRQVAIYKAALAYGYSYGTAVSGVDPLTGNTAAVMRGVSPRQMLAVYDDPGEDDWPVHALRVKGGLHSSSVTFTLYDDELVHEVGRDGDGWTYLGAYEHGAGVCPVVRFCADLDLEGRTPGEVEPYIEVAQRINKTAFDRLLVQHFNSWKVRTATGLDKPESEEEAQKAKVKLRQQDILTGEGDVEFGTLPETSMDGFISAGETDLEALAATSRTSTHGLTGKMINLSAEALAAAEAETQRKAGGYKKSFGITWPQWFRLSCHLEGNDAGAADFTSRGSWADIESRSLAQAVDALGKAAQMLQVPVQALWSRIPGVTQTDVAEWKQLAEAGDEYGTYLRGMAEQAETAQQAAAQDPAAVKAAADALGALVRSGVEPEDAARRVGLGGVRFTGAVPVSLRLPEGDAAALEQA